MNNIKIEDLLRIIKIYNPEEVEIVKKTYEFAEQLHKGQKRQSGDDYITHPLNVAYILAEMHADKDTVCAGLLHDTLEDTEITKEDISELINPTVAELVDGVTKLAKMNLLLNNIRGEIVEANSFYADPHNAVGRFDYVMANPPFNVDEVVYERVKDDARFNTYGIPKNKSKTAKKDSDKKETVPNANYLWISYFASALKETGKAALVMANSASDAGNSEYDIRKNLIESGMIKQMVTLPSNMFSSVTLPATLWFFDKSKIGTERKDEILFVDARNIFTQVDRAHRKFSDEQIKNLKEGVKR